MKQTPLKRTGFSQKPRKPMPRKSKRKTAHEASPEGQEDAAYIRAVRSLPCCICDGFGEPQNSPTQAHHVIHGRHGNRKTPDRMAIPLCEGHHLGDFDTSKIALHREPDMWKEAYGLDTEYTAATRDRVEASL